MANDYENIEKRLVDKGWAGMSKILDREMPARRRRRGLFWLFGGLGLAFLAALAMLNYPQMRQEERRQPVPAPEKRMPRNQPVASSDAVVPKENTPAAAPVQKRTGQKNAQSNEFKVRAKSHMSTEKAVAVANAVEIPPLPAPEIALPATPVQTSETASVSVRQNVLGAIDLFQTLPVQPDQVDMPTRSGALSATPIKRPARFRRFYPGIYLAAQSGALNVPESWSAGLQAEYRAVGRFGIRAGLGYQNRAFKPEQRLLTEIKTVQYLQTTQDSALFEPLLNNIVQYDVVENSSVTIPVYRLHRLELPVQCWYQFADRWRVYGGTSLNYTYAVESGSRSLVRNTNGQTLEVLTPDESTRTAVDALLTSSLRGWDVQAIFGLGFRPVRNLEIGLGYRALIGNPFEGSNTDNSLLDFNGTNIYSKIMSSPQSIPSSQWQLSAHYSF